MPKPRAIFRLTPENRVTIPLLLNVWERAGIDGDVDVVLADDLSSAAPFARDDVVLFSFMTPQLPREVEAARLPKAAGALLAAGGPHATGDPEFAREAGFDLVFAGPAETTFRAFGEELAGGRLDRTPRVIRAATEPPLDLALPVSRRLRTAPPLELTRGCSHACAFCATGGSTPRHRSAGSIAEYFDILRSRGTTRINFIAPSAFEYGKGMPGGAGRPPEGAAGGGAAPRIFEVLDAARDAGFAHVECGMFPSELRPDTVTAPLLAELAGRVANRRVTFGAQSGEAGALAALGRGHDLGAVEAAAVAAREAGLLANVDFIVGLPGETAGSRAETFRYARRLHREHKCRCLFHHFFPIAGSAYAGREPAWLGGGEREALRALGRIGAAEAWWVEDERRARDYFGWLAREMPARRARYA